MLLKAYNCYKVIYCQSQLSNCVLSVGGDGVQLSRDSIEFQDLVCVCVCAFSAPPRSVGKEKINLLLLTRLVMEPNPEYSFCHL